MATPTGEEITLTIPAESFVRRHACGVDFGGSLIKLAYTESSSDPTKLKIRCLSYSTEDLRDAMKEFKTRAGPALATGEPIKTCGVGCSQHTATMKETLGVDLDNMLEFVRFSDAFKFLSESLPAEDFLHPETKKTKLIREEHLADTESHVKAYSQISGPTLRISKDTYEDEEDDGNQIVRSYQRYVRDVAKDRERECIDTQISQRSGDTKQSYVKYPILLYMCGSAGCPLMVTADGKVNPLDVRPMGGRYFTALGRLMCGDKSYEELITLAESSTNGTVNVWAREITGDSDDGYDGFPRHQLAYAFGRAATNKPDSFRPEDLAAATMTSLAEAVAEHAQLWALLLCIKDIYFVGSMVNSRLARDEIGKFSTIRSTANVMGATTNHHFVKPCGYLGAIGCLLATLRTELPSGTQE